MCEVGTVVVTTQVAEPYVAQGWVVVLYECLCTLVVGEVSATVANAFLKDEGIVSGTKQFGVVVGFKHYVSGVLKGLRHFGSHLAYVGHKREDGIACSDGVAYVGCGVVGNGKCRDAKVCYLEGCSQFDNLAMGFVNFPRYVFVGKETCMNSFNSIDGHVQLLSEFCSCFYVVGMIVGKQDCFYMFAVDAVVVECLSEFPNAYSCIDEDG